MYISEVIIMNIGDRIRQLREDMNLTQEEVGKRIGVTKATINRYETGEIDIKRTIAIKLAGVLDTTPSYIMGWCEVNQDIKIEKSQNELSLLEQINQMHGKSVSEGFSLYVQLDIEDRAEIRGTMKHMLTSEKYSKQDGASNENVI